MPVAVVFQRCHDRHASETLGRKLVGNWSVIYNFPRMTAQFLAGG